MVTALSSIVIPPTVATTSSTAASLIFLHGLGDSGHGWSATFRFLQKTLPFFRLIFPHAPSRKVSLNFGLSMPAWYDLYSLDETDDREDRPGIVASASQLHNLIAAEVQAGVPSDRIFVGGFSQGGVVALYAGLTHNIRLGGIIALSAYLPLRRDLPTLLTTRPPCPTPIFMAHGTVDTVVRYQWGVDSANYLKTTINCPVDFYSYPGLQHSSCQEELEDILAFITRNLSDTTTTAAAVPSTNVHDDEL